jgi:hypothetical protein
LLRHLPDGILGSLMELIVWQLTQVLDRGLVISVVVEFAVVRVI